MAAESRGGGFSACVTTSSWSSSTPSSRSAPSLPSLDQFLTSSATRRHRREGRRLGPSPARLRDQQEVRGHLRRRRPEGRARDGQGAGPPAQPQRGGAAHQGHAPRPALTPALPTPPRTRDLTHGAGDTVITLVGNLTDDPELRFTPSGAAVANFRVASTPRILDKQTNEWKDGETPLPAPATSGGRPPRTSPSPSSAACASSSQGRLKQRSYETKEGEKRTGVELEVDEVGPSLRYATAKVTKAIAAPVGGFGGGSGGADSDPWARRPGGHRGGSAGGDRGGGWNAPGGAATSLRSDGPRASDPTDDRPSRHLPGIQ